MMFPMFCKFPEEKNFLIKRILQKNMIKPKISEIFRKNKHNQPKVFEKYFI